MRASETSSQPTIEVLWPRPDVAQVVLGGEHDLASAEEVGDTLEALMSASMHLTVDVSKVEFMDSSAIKELLIAKREADAADVRFNLLLGTASIVEHALEITDVLTDLNRVHTLDEALAVGYPSGGRTVATNSSCERGSSPPASSSSAWTTSCSFARNAQLRRRSNG